MDSDSAKIPLPQFLKLLTSNAIPVPKAMSIAGKVYKAHNTRESLAQLSDVKLKALGVESAEDCKLVMTALRKSGYVAKPEGKKKVVTSPQASGSTSPSKTLAASSPSRPGPSSTKKTSPKRKRKQSDVGNEFLPDGPSDDAEEIGTWNFEEITDEEAIKLKYTVINRAPVMMAWATLVAETSAYTEMNAVTKGVSLGIYKRDEERGREASKHGTQPYVELIGRRPLYRTHAGQWRALSNGKPVPPSSAFQYISRSFRETTPFIMGALKLLADSYTSKELNERAWSLYADFRPEVNQWGKRSEIHCSLILNLRKKVPGLGKELVRQAGMDEKPMIGYDSPGAVEAEEPNPKKARTLTVEEYEAALDDDTTFDHIDLDVALNPPDKS